MFAEIKNDYVEEYWSSNNQKILEFHIDAWNTKSSYEEGKTIVKIVVENNEPIKISFKDPMYKKYDDVISIINNTLKNILNKYLLLEMNIDFNNQKKSVIIKELFYSNDNICANCNFKNTDSGLIEGIHYENMKIYLKDTDICQQLINNNKSLYDILLSSNDIETVKLVKKNPIVTSITLKDVIETIQNCYDVKEITNIFKKCTIQDIFDAVYDDIDVNAAEAIENVIDKNF